MLKLGAQAKSTLHPWGPVLASQKVQSEGDLLIESGLPSFDR